MFIVVLQAPCVMSGTRNGKIMLWDIREVKGSTPPSVTLQVHKRAGNSVTCLNVLQRDENYVISTSANGTVSG